MGLFDRLLHRNTSDDESRDRQAPRGMTLVEVMIVITILASIMGVVGVYVFGALNQAQSDTARLGIKNLREKVEFYYIRHSQELPESLNALSEGPNPLIKDESKLNDPWGNKYVYEKQGGQEFKIFSVGPDGSRGTKDDVHRKKQEE